MYNLENIEKYVLFQKLQWPPYPRICILTCEINTASSTGTNQAFFLAVLISLYQLRISDTNSLCARSEIVTVKLMEDCAALGNDTVLSIYIWVPAFQRGFYLEDRGKMLYWDVGTLEPIYTSNIPEDWQLSPMVPNILYIMCSVMPAMSNVASAHAQPSLMESWFKFWSSSDHWDHLILAAKS